MRHHQSARSSSRRVRDAFVNILSVSVSRTGVHALLVRPEEELCQMKKNVTMELPSQQHVPTRRQKQLKQRNRKLSPQYLEISGQRSAVSRRCEGELPNWTRSTHSNASA